MAPQVTYPKRIQSSEPPDGEEAFRIQRKHIWWHRIPANYSWGYWHPNWQRDMKPTAHTAKKMLEEYRNRGKLSLPEDFRVSRFSEGSFNVLFQVEFSYPAPRAMYDIPSKCLLRIPKPIDPWYKLESEVATAMYAMEQGLPVPAVYCFDSSRDNSFGLEWSIVESIEGISLSTLLSHWLQDTSLEQLEDIAMGIQASMRNLRRLPNDKRQWNKIGSIYCDWSALGTDKQYFIGRIVKCHFYQGSRLSYNVNRGPYDSAQQYLEARLAIWEREAADLEAIIEMQGDETVVPAVRTRVIRLRQFLNLLGPRLASPAFEDEIGERRGRLNLRPNLFHSDLHGSNIMVDVRTKKLTAILD
jgi:hypothetical protein